MTTNTSIQIIILEEKGTLVLQNIELKINTILLRQWNCFFHTTKHATCQTRMNFLLSNNYITKHELYNQNYEKLNDTIYTVLHSYNGS